MTESERHTQYIVREKMSGLSMVAPKCRGALLVELMHEMKQLKEELDGRKYGKFYHVRFLPSVLILILKYSWT